MSAKRFSLGVDMYFCFQMPVPRNSRDLDYSRWQQNLIGVLQIDVIYHSQFQIGNLFTYLFIYLYTLIYNIFNSVNMAIMICNTLF